MILSISGPLHASHVADALHAELSATLFLLTDMLRDQTLEHPSPGLWALGAQGWREVRTLAAPPKAP
ncbi:MAG: hypothetical protein MUF54_07590 [Polyangiaceae bacterium]|jgi:hypothetical protein|nr:hypothetical protein [Polyangiaceae bacterium]